MRRATSSSSSMAEVSSRKRPSIPRLSTGGITENLCVDENRCLKCKKKVGDEAIAL